MIEKIVSHFEVDYILRFKNDIDIGVDAATMSMSFFNLVGVKPYQLVS